jgi:NADPH:quinone reductase-like Zn-dependent oxidoreductase
VKAALRDRYGSADVVRVGDVPTPVPGDDEVLVRVHAAVVGVVDSVAREGSPRYARLYFGLLRPRFPLLGSDFAGRVEAVGPAVTRFAVGDEVFGTVAPRFGAHAEYVRLSQDAALARKPARLTYAQAAALVDTTALVFLRDKAHLTSGQSVLVNGASGSVGTSAVQLARHFGAQVTGVCSGPNTDLVEGLGAGAVLDYTTSDFTRAGTVYDVVFDVAGTSSFARSRGVVRRGGVYLTTEASPMILLRMAWTARFGDRRAIVAFTGLRDAAAKRADLAYLAGLADAGELVPVVDTCYPLADIADAYRHVDRGHKRGNVIVTMADPI